MNLNGKTMNHLLDIERDEVKKGNEYFYSHRFTMFTLAIQSGKATVLDALIQNQKMTENEVAVYIGRLENEGLLSQNDRKLLKRITGNFKTENFENEIAQVVSHFNRVANKRSRTGKSTSEKIISLLKSGYSVKDLKKVSLFFTMKWSSDPKMSQYVSMDTFFRKTKFEEKLNMANEFFDELDKHAKEIKTFCQEFKGLIVAEYIQRGRFSQQAGCEIAVDACQDIPLQLQSILIHWLNQGYTMEEIIETVKATIESWSKKKELAPYILLSRILDEKFPIRFSAAQKIKSKAQSFSNGGVAEINEWIAKGGENA